MNSLITRTRARDLLDPIRIVALVSVLAISAFLLVLPPFPAHGAVVCTYDPLTLKISITSTGADSINVALSPSGAVFVNGALCTGPGGTIATVANSDEINVTATGADANQTLNIDFGAGPLVTTANPADRYPFGPGATNEAPERGEVEINVNLGGGNDTMKIFGLSDELMGTDRMTFGDLGMAFNEDTDADLLHTGVEEFELHGRGADDIIRGSGGFGSGGPTPFGFTIDGGLGMDTETGGAGDDTFSQFVADPNENNGMDQMRGGDGIDTVDYSSRIGDEGMVCVTLDSASSTDEARNSDDGQSRDSDCSKSQERDNAGGAVEDIENVIGSKGYRILPGVNEPGGVPVSVGGVLGDTITGNEKDNSLDGGPGDNLALADAGCAPAVAECKTGVKDTLSGGAGADTLIGRGGSDVLSAGDGDDLVSGGAGRDSLTGGAGNDRLIGDDNTVGPTEPPGQPTGGGPGAVSGTTAFPAAHRDSLVGGAGNDFMDGGSDNDTFNERDFAANGGGTDVIIGGDGPVDYVDYCARTVPVVVTLADNGANDGQAGEADNVGAVSGGDVERVRGGRNNDLLVGNAGNNELVGGALTTCFTGDTSGAGDGADTLLGAAGNDFLTSGDGDDLLQGQDGDDVLTDGLGDDISIGGDGDDRFSQEGQGSTAAPQGADLLIGGPGSDTVDYSAREDPVFVDLADNTANDGDGCDLTSGGGAGCEGDNAGAAPGGDIENIFGGRGNDTLKGNASANYINADRPKAKTSTQEAEPLRRTGGVDTLEGRDGDDRLEGGPAGDTFIPGEGGETLGDTLDYHEPSEFDATGVTVSLAAGCPPPDGCEQGGSEAQNDIFQVGAFENLIGTSFPSGTTHASKMDTLTGDAQNNIISGGTGNDVISSGDGNDTLNGGAGNDTENGGNGDDTFFQEAAVNGADVMTGGDGNDTIDYSERTNPVTITFDDANDDGEVGEADNVKSDIERANAIRIIESAGSTTVSEGGAGDSYSLIMTIQPTTNVTVAVNPSSQVTASRSTVVFTTSNWDVTQTVSVSAVDDEVDEATPHAALVTHTVTSSDPKIGSDARDVNVAVNDNDTAGVTLTESGGSTAVSEGGSGDSYTVRLDTQPTSDVEITSVPDSQVDVSPDVLTFTSANWNVPQTFNVSAVDDTQDEPSPHPSKIIHFSTSADSNYNFVSVADVDATVFDNDLAPLPPGPVQAGYWFVASDGGIFSFGRAGFHGSTGGRPLNQPIVGMAAHPAGCGYWFVAADGGIFSFGCAQFHGSTGSLKLNSPIVGMAAHPSGNGYWFVAADGGIFAFGQASFRGSTGGLKLNSPIVGMAAHPSGNGYWMVARDGGIFAFGQAPFRGSTGGTKLNSAIVGMDATPSGNGYWFVAGDGGIFSFGDAPFRGSTGGTKLAAPIVGMAATKSGAGYWFVASDGGVFSFGDAGFAGSTGGTKLNQPIVGMDNLS